MSTYKRTPDEIRASIEQNRQELSTSLVRLRDEVTELTDWRGRLRKNQQNLQIAASVAGFVVAGGITGLGGALLRGATSPGRKRRRRRF
jgi:hypothetical protein